MLAGECRAGCDPHLGALELDGGEPLPPAVFVAASADPMYDSQVAFAKRYSEAGGQTLVVEAFASHVLVAIMDPVKWDDALNGWAGLVKGHSITTNSAHSKVTS